MKKRGRRSMSDDLAQPTRETVHNWVSKPHFNINGEYFSPRLLYTVKVLKVSGMGSVSLYFGLNVIHGLGLWWKPRHRASKRRKIHSGLFAGLLILKQQHKYSSGASRQKLCKSITQPTLSLSTVSDSLWQKAGGTWTVRTRLLPNPLDFYYLAHVLVPAKSLLHLLHIRLYSKELKKREIKHGCSVGPRQSWSPVSTLSDCFCLSAVFGTLFPIQPSTPD